MAGPFSLSEGPAWTGEELLFTDILSSRIIRYTPTTGTCVEAYGDTGAANGLTFDREGRLYVCEHTGRRVARYEADGTRITLADRYQGKRLNSPNDLVVDRQGRVWFSDPRYSDRADMELDHESIYRLDPRADGTWAITRMTFDTGRPNGLAFSLDYLTLYVAESPTPGGNSELRRYPVNPDGSLGPYRVLHDFGPHRGIDGMRVDAAGDIIATCGWTGSGPGPRIAIFSPRGELIAHHPTPSNPTNCSFGGPDLRTLYVTGFEGAVYRAETDRQGVKRP